MMNPWSKDVIPVEQALTLDGLFLHRVRRSPQREAYRWFDRASNAWRSITWAETAAQSARWREALAGEALAPGDRVAVLLRNCPEWVTFDQAALSLGLVTVPLYPDDQAENVAHILRDSGAKLLLVQDLPRWNRIAETIAGQAWPLRVVILDVSTSPAFQASPDSCQDSSIPIANQFAVLGRVSGAGVSAAGRRREAYKDEFTASPATGARPETRRNPMSFGYSHGRAVPSPAMTVSMASDWLPSQSALWEQRPAQPDALATIVYTSGTTGKSKGVMLTHRNILSNAHAAVAVLDVYQEDVFLSFLPLSHMLERTASYYLPMMAGSTVAYARSVAQLAEDLKSVRPTVIIAVPRVFERVYQRLNAQIRQRPATARWLFDLATRVGWLAFEREQQRRGWNPQLLLWPLLRHLVAGKVLERLGGRIRAAVSGGAPLPPDVARLFIGLGLPLIQGYGLTETSPVVSVNPLEDNRPETVGIPLSGVQVRIGELDELQVRGPGVMRGYWNNPEATAQVLKDGWFRTGDQARLIGRHLQITGRLKDILVLSNGEKVSPADMEMAIGLDPLFEQAMVIGEGKPFLSALLVLNAELWPSLAEEYQLDPKAPASLEDQRLVKAMLARVRQALVGFPGYAKVRRLTLALEPWSIDNGLLTPTMKVKRHQVIRRHRDKIDRMYSE